MQAIPTAYAGTQFRSRLEADWAYTLDSIAMPWQYEPEGFRLSDGRGYSPDFYLPTARAWLEVKGSHDLGLDLVEQFAADLWAESGSDVATDEQAPLVMVGRSPLRSAGLPSSMPLQASFIGMRGPGKAYSVGIASCPECQQMTAFALWPNACRNCHIDAGQDWCGGYIQYQFTQGFSQLPRPAGRTPRTRP